MSTNATTASRGGGGGNPAQSRRRVQRAFKMRGLAVQAGALDAMLKDSDEDVRCAAVETLSKLAPEVVNAAKA